MNNYLTGSGCAIVWSNFQTIWGVIKISSETCELNSVRKGTVNKEEMAVRITARWRQTYDAINSCTRRNLFPSERRR